MKDLEDFAAILSSQVEQVAYKTLEDAGKLGEQAARDTRLFKNQGSLRAATNFHKTSDTTGFILADKSYAAFLEEGNPSQGFKILPKNAKVLHFVIDGKDVFTKSSTAHGPLPFMQEAQNTVEKEITNIFNNNFDQIVGR